jgi:hypothetical protein
MLPKLTNMKTLLYFLMVCITLSSCAPCIEGTGENITIERTIENFTELEIDGAFKVTIEQDRNLDKPQITLIGQQNIIDKINTNVKGGKLNIEFSERCYHVEEVIEIHIKIIDIKSIEADGASDVKALSLIKSDDLELDVDGAANIEMELRSNELTINADGAASFNLSGETDEMNIKIDGAGSVKAFNLFANIIEVKVDGAGVCEVNARDELDVKITGIGEVKYKGSPKDFNQSINGAGKVTKVD